MKTKRIIASTVATLLLASSIFTTSVQSIEAESNENQSKFFFNLGVKDIPHFDKRHKGGEDAWVAQEDLLVVADGVGGWASEGIDAGLFSK